MTLTLTCIALWWHTALACRHSWTSLHWIRSFSVVSLKLLVSFGVGWSKRVEYEPGTGSLPLFPSMHLETCEESVTSIQANIELETSHIGKGCDRETYSEKSLHMLCGKQPLFYWRWREWIGEEGGGLLYDKNCKKCKNVIGKNIYAQPVTSSKKYACSCEEKIDFFLPPSLMMKYFFSAFQRALCCSHLCSCLCSIIKKYFVLLSQCNRLN